jgi:hypothetical protein
MIEPVTLVALRTAEAKALLHADYEDALGHVNRCFAQQERRWRERWFMPTNTWLGLYHRVSRLIDG